MSFGVRVKSVSNRERIGVYGGTFDPIHKTHLSIARAAREFTHLDRVLFVVSARPPHKRRGPYATPEERYAMVEAAVLDEPGMEASRLEMDRGGVSYTHATLMELTSQYPEAELYLIVGLDSLVDLPRWRNAAGILALSRLLVAPRPEPRAVPPELEGRYELLPFEPTRVSSTEVRKRVAAGEPIGDLAPPAVERVIRERGIYHAGPCDAARR